MFLKSHEEGWRSKKVSIVIDSSVDITWSIVAVVIVGDGRWHVRGKERNGYEKEKKGK